MYIYFADSHPNIAVAKTQHNAMCFVNNSYLMSMPSNAKTMSRDSSIDSDGSRYASHQYNTNNTYPMSAIVPLYNSKTLPGNHE